MKRYGQLHTHTPASDGTITIEDIVMAGLDFVAITDHDTIANVGHYHQALAEHGIEVIPGIEISIRHKEENMHLLCYWPQLKKGAEEMLKAYRHKRLGRGLSMLHGLELQGFAVPQSAYDALRATSGAITKGNVADAILAETQNQTRLIQEGITPGMDRMTARNRFIRTYVRRGKPAYVLLAGMPLKEVMRRIEGVFVLAHPGHDLNCENALHDAIIEDMARTYHLAGIESGSRKHSAIESDHYARLSDRLGLVNTQSSDAHRPCQLRQGMIEHSILDELYCCKPAMKPRMNAPSP